MTERESANNEYLIHMRRLQAQIDAMLKNAGMSSLDAYTLSVDIFHAVMNSEIVDGHYLEQYQNDSSK